MLRPPAQDSRAARLEAAVREAAAAEAVLMDRRCLAESAASHLVLGWVHLLEGLGVPDEGRPLWARIAGTAVPGLHTAQRDEAAAGLEPLVGAHEATLAGGARTRLERPLVHRQAWLLRRAVRAAQREALRDLPLPRRLAMGFAVALPLVALVATGVALNDGDGHGWTGHYYADLSMAEPALVRTDAALKFDWGHASPGAGLPKDGFAARWSACLEVTEPERLEFRLGSDDGSRLFVDGEKVIDNWKDQSMHWMSRAVVLEPGTHHLQVDFYEKTSGARVELEINRTTRPARPLEASRLRPASDDGAQPCGT